MASYSCCGRQPASSLLRSRSRSSSAGAAAADEGGGGVRAAASVCPNHKKGWSTQLGPSPRPGWGVEGMVRF